MGQVFEELLRRFSEMSNETSGEHYTPRDVVRLLVSLLFAEHREDLSGQGDYTQYLRSVLRDRRYVDHWEGILPRSD